MFNNLFGFFCFFLNKFSIKNRFLYKIFFLLHLLQVQQHMMMVRDDRDDNESDDNDAENNINDDGNLPIRIHHFSNISLCNLGQQK